jgi:L-amino acid N-acyltransferase YncA
MTFQFQPLDEAGIQIYRSWFEDAITRKRISYPDEIWVNYVQHSDHVYVWTIWQAADCVGVLQADVENNLAYFVLTMNPAFRGRGYCKKIIQTFVELEEMQTVRVFEAQIEKDNIASLKCHAAAGFKQVSEDEDFYHWRRQVVAPSHAVS